MNNRLLYSYELQYNDVILYVAKNGKQIGKQIVGKQIGVMLYSSKMVRVIMGHMHSLYNLNKF